MTAALHTFLREERRAFQVRSNASSAWKTAGRAAAMRNFER